MQNAKVYFISAKDLPSRRESGPHSIQVLRMDAGGKILKRCSLNVHSPQAMGALIEGDLVGIDIPRPQRDARCIGGDPQPVGISHCGACSFR